MTGINGPAYINVSTSLVTLQLMQGLLDQCKQWLSGLSEPFIDIFCLFVGSSDPDLHFKAAQDLLAFLHRFGQELSGLKTDISPKIRPCILRLLSADAR